MERIYYTVIKNGKPKTYVDRRWCYCEAHTGPHIHPKRKGKE